jgi:hypothetical protein
LWLVGFAFSKTDQNNFEISGSTTSNEMKVLKQEGITPYLISIQNDGISQMMTFPEG